MNNFSILSAAITVLLALSGCSKDDGVQNTRTTRLSVKLDGDAITRSIERLASSNQTAGIENGFIYVINSSGVATPYELIVEEAQSSAGQFIGEVAVNSTVYIVANIPNSENRVFESLSSLNEIKFAESNISTQIDYNMVALANRSALPVAVSDADGNGEALVRVNLAPLISRLELTRVTSVAIDDYNSPNYNSYITSFEVAGVYVDQFFTSFRWDGTGVGLYQMGPAPDYGEILSYGMGDETIVSSLYDSFYRTADVRPGQYRDRVWAYNVASGGLPLLVVKIRKIIINGGSDTKITLSGQITPVRAFDQTFFLSVKRYTGMSTATFERGNIYRCYIEFNVNHLKYTRPDPDNVELMVNVKVDQWKINGIGAEI